MASLFRRPFAVSTSFKQFSAPSTSLVRAFHTSKSAFQSPLVSESLTLSKARQPIFQNAFRNISQNGSRRTYTQQAPSIQTNNSELRTKLIYGAGIFGGTLLAINL